MRAKAVLFAVAMLVLPGPGQAADAVADETTAIIEQASQLILKKQPAVALALLETALTKMEPSVSAASAKGRVYCATGPAEILLYGALTGTTGQSATVLGPQLCNALFIKAYALNELRRAPDGVATLEQLTALAPLHAHYFVELGYSYRMIGAPDKAMSAYRAALDNAEAPGVEDAKADRAAALRGIGYLLIDKNDLDGAVDAYRKSLEEDPSSAIAKSELEYIDGLRKKSR
jgi:tetratricopeptide (TPR) repeat protein